MLPVSNTHTSMRRNDERQREGWPHSCRQWACVANALMAQTIYYPSIFLQYDQFAKPRIIYHSLSQWYIKCTDCTTCTFYTIWCELNAASVRWRSRKCLCTVTTTPHWHGILPVSLYSVGSCPSTHRTPLNITIILQFSSLVTVSQLQTLIHNIEDTEPRPHSRPFRISLDAVALCTREGYKTNDAYRPRRPSNIKLLIQ